MCWQRFIISAILTKSRFGKPVIILGPYRFNKNNRSRGPKALWFCSKSSSGCRASITTIDDVIIKINDSHSHQTTGVERPKAVSRHCIIKTTNANALQQILSMKNAIAQENPTDKVIIIPQSLNILGSYPNLR